MAWVVNRRNGLVRVPRRQDPVEPLAIRAMAIAIGGECGQIWTATTNEILRLDNKGVTILRIPFEKPSEQVWLAAF